MRRWPYLCGLAEICAACAQFNPTGQSSTVYQDSELARADEVGIFYYHIMPKIAGPLVVTAVLDIGVILMELAGLSFLGLGAMPPMAEWGSMLSLNRSLLQTAPWLLLAPGGAIVVTVAYFHYVGENLRQYFDKI